MSTKKLDANITEKMVKSRVKDIIKIFSKYTPIYTFCPMTFGYGESGHPDRILLVKGNFLGIEVKKDANNHHSRPELKPKPNEVMQKRQAMNIKMAGGDWLCIHKDNLDELIDLLFKYAPAKIFSQKDVKKLEELVLWHS